MPDAIDIAIVGAGLSGVMAACRLSQKDPQARIILIDKEERVGGRMRSLETKAASGYGLGMISPDLFDFCAHSAQAGPSEQNLFDLVNKRQEQVGVLAGSRLSQIPISELFSSDGARTVGGAVAAREWSKVEEVLANERTSGKASFAQSWKHTKKNAAGVVLELLCPVLGIPDLWTASSQAIKKRLQILASQPYVGQWTPAFEALLQHHIREDRLELRLNCHVLNATYDSDLWKITTDTGEVTCKQLVVAHSPWEATLWLPRDLCPVPVSTLAAKTRPVSVVTLTQDLEEKPNELNGLTIVCAEKVQALNDSGQNICFQATIDFEQSLQAPAVLKAIRRLKRARKKLETVEPALSKPIGPERIALVSIGWAQSPCQLDRRWLDKVTYKNLNTPNLAFCGEAYGSDYDYDRNIAASLTELTSVPN